MKLLIEYFLSSNYTRDSEYKACINENLKNELIDEIFVFISDNSILDIQSQKLRIINLSERPTFKYLFDYCNNNLNGQICIIANTDIFFDNSLSHLLNSNLENTFISLTRWDLFFDQNQWQAQFYNHPFRGGPATTGMLSQDSWIFRSPIKTDDRTNFLMGKPGCDNRIIQILHENGYNVKNPSMKIITKHLHISNYRTYNNTDMVLGPYLLVEPTDSLEKESQKQTIKHF